jgi:hypothetical protein
MDMILLQSFILLALLPGAEAYPMSLQHIGTTTSIASGAVQSFSAVQSFNILLSQQPPMQKAFSLSTQVAPQLAPLGWSALNHVKKSLDSLNQARRMNIFLTQLRPAEELLRGMDDAEKKRTFTDLWEILWGEQLGDSANGKIWQGLMGKEGTFKDDHDMLEAFGEKIYKESEKREIASQWGRIQEGIDGASSERKFSLAAVASGKERAKENHDEVLKELQTTAAQDDRYINLFTLALSAGQGFLLNSILELSKWKQVSIDVHAVKTNTAMSKINGIIQQASQITHPIVSTMDEGTVKSYKLREWKATLGKIEEKLNDGHKDSRITLENQQEQHNLLEVWIKLYGGLQCALMLFMFLTSALFFARQQAMPQGSSDKRNVAAHVAIVVVFVIMSLYASKLLWDMNSSDMATRIDETLSSLQDLLVQIHGLRARIDMALELSWR